MLWHCKDLLIQESDNSLSEENYAQMNRGPNLHNEITRSDYKKISKKNFWVDKFPLKLKPYKAKGAGAKSKHWTTLVYAAIYWHYKDLCRQKYVQDKSLYRDKWMI